MKNQYPLIAYEFTKQAIEKLDYRHFLATFGADKLPAGPQLKDMLGRLAFAIRDLWYCRQSQGLTTIVSENTSFSDEAEMAAPYSPTGDDGNAKQSNRTARNCALHDKVHFVVIPLPCREHSRSQTNRGHC
jgi:hypothetical protein